MQNDDFSFSYQFKKKRSDWFLGVVNAKIRIYSSERNQQPLR
jgi:hypothetical protein